MTEPAYLAEDYDDDGDIKIINHGDIVTLVFFDVDGSLKARLIERFKEDRQRDRRAAVRARQLEERRNKRITRAATRLQLDAVWFTSLDERINISDMTPRHARRSLDLLLHAFGRWVGDGDIDYRELGLPYPIADSPLAKALLKRSKTKETKRHRALDELFDGVFRAAASGKRVNLWETVQEFDKVHSGKF